MNRLAILYWPKGNLMCPIMHRAKEVTLRLISYVTNRALFKTVKTRRGLEK